jgi:hypothetical protein
MSTNLPGWTTQFGKWDFKSDVIKYLGPHFPAARPFGICASSSASREGVVRVTVTIPSHPRLSSEGPSAGLLVGYSRRAASYAVGIGGHARKYTLVRHDPTNSSWTLLEGAGNASDLEIAHPYRLACNIDGSKIGLYDESDLVFDYLLPTPISEEGRLGLFAWGDSPIEFSNVWLERASPADAAISATLESFDRESVWKAWIKALDRRSSDPEGAITSARTLLESVCKLILEKNQKTYSPTADLPALYYAAAEVLTLAPSQHTEETLKRMLGGCQQVVNTLGELRNRVGDAHGAGSQPPQPTARHASLAVNLAGAMAMFLVETGAAR